MKKLVSLLLSVFTILCLGVALVGCGGGGKSKPPIENEYEYNFSIGKGEHKVDLAYVVKTSYTAGDNITSYEVYPKIGDKTLTNSIAMNTFSGKDGLLQVAGMELKLESGYLSYVSGDTYAFIPQCSTLAGTYQLAENSILHEDERLEGKDLSLVLNADGTGMYLEKPLTFFPLGVSSVVLVADADQNNGLIVNLSDGNIYQPDGDSISFNFTIGAKMQDFYKVYFDNNTTYITGGGLFKFYSLSYNDTHFIINGQNWLTGTYEKKDGGIMVLHNIYAESEDDSTSPEIVIYSDCFDFEREKTYTATAGELYYYKSGRAYASMNYQTFSENCYIPKGADELDIPAIYCPEAGLTYIFDKETLETLYTVNGDTYINPKDYTVYNDVCDQPKAEPHVNILISEDKTEVYFESVYPSENRVIYRKYDNTELIFNNSALLLNGDFYFLIEKDKYVSVPSYNLPILSTVWNSVTEFEIIRIASVSHKHYPTGDTYNDYTADDVYFITASWDDSVIYFSIDFEKAPDTDYFSYTIFPRESNTLLTEHAPGTSILFTDNKIAITKKTDENISFVYFDNIEGAGITHVDNDDGFITIYDPTEKYYYLIGEESLEIEYVIKDDEYSGLKDARFIKPAGIDSVTIKEDHYYNQQTFSNLIVVGDKLYKPTSCEYNYKCAIYETYECTFPKLMAGEVIEYNVTRYDDNLSDYVTEPYYYYVNEKGYYALNDVREWLDPAGLADFTLIEGSVKYYSAHHNGYDEDMILETAEYVDDYGTEYLLILGYKLIDCYDFGNYIIAPDMTMYTLDCGTCVESEDGFTLTAAHGVYVVTIDDEYATITRTA